MRQTGPYRLPSGGLVDRGRKLRFAFNSRPYFAYHGDTLASGLLANGIRTVARSIKFHRPRGVFSCGIEEPNALMQVGDGALAIPSARAPVIELADGMRAYSQTGWPGLGFDAGRILDIWPSLWAAGFYNKAFIWPNWGSYETIIRNMSGLGRTPPHADPDRYETTNRHSDVLVVGGGMAGLTAAYEAARAGSRVLLAEQDTQLGGRAAWDGSWPEMAARIATLITELRAMPDVTLIPQTTAVGYYDHNVVTLVQRAGHASDAFVRERLWIVRAKRVVLATGLLEQPLIFDHNDRPGIMLAGAARDYIRRYGVAPGSLAVVATNNDSAYSLVSDLHKAGVGIACVVDSRAEVLPSILAAMRSLNIRLFTASLPVNTAGFRALRNVTIGHLSPDADRVLSTKTFVCDALLVSGGWNPALHLYAQAGGKLLFDSTSGGLIPASQLPGTNVAGAASELSDSPVGPRLSPVGNPQRQWVDLLQDVTVADLELALRERYASVEHVKRYTTVGMGADQGKTSTVASLEVLARLRHVHPSELGYTTQRPPFTPVTVGAIVGRDTGDRFTPIRLLPLNDWHRSNGALFQDFSGWQRPVAYLRDNESRDQATQREARGVRTGVALFDGSPLGKIEVQGPDALAFVNHFYINNLTTLKPGSVRYGIMLRESGVIFDDGTITLIAPDHVLISTTSGNAARVTDWLEEWHQCEWPHLRVAITPVTEQWATISLTGPQSRAILSRLNTGIALTAEAFPHLTMREGRIFGSVARVFRVSFTGETTYEINISARLGLQLWEYMMELGRTEGVQPLGLDAMLQLRLEKGFLHVGTDTDGTTIPDDVGWGRVASAKASSYIGKRSLSLAENVRRDRLQLVGLTAKSPVLTVGSHLRLPGSDRSTDGWITSAGRLVASGQPIALAMLRGGLEKVGSEVFLYDGNTIGRAQVAAIPFLDPTGEKLNA